MIKIVIPTNSNKGLEDNIAEHFGRCNTYTFLDEKGKVIKIIDNTSEHMGGLGLPPKLMKKHGANILLCRELGPRALNLCQHLGIDVYIGQVRTAKEIFKLWKDNKIKKADLSNVCEKHRL
jgi:predicted Fe-Mo cluster-binding NifX family protein